MNRKAEQVVHPNGDITTKIARERYEKMYEVRNFILVGEYENGYSRHWMILRAMKEFGVTDNFCRVAIRDFRKYHFGNGIRIRPMEQEIEADRNKRLQQRIEANTKVNV